MKRILLVLAVVASMAACKKEENVEPTSTYCYTFIIEKTTTYTPLFSGYPNIPSTSEMSFEDKCDLTETQAKDKAKSYESTSIFQTSAKPPGSTTYHSYQVTKKTRCTYNRK